MLRGRHHGKSAKAPNHAASRASPSPTIHHISRRNLAKKPAPRGKIPNPHGPKPFHLATKIVDLVDAKSSLTLKDVKPKPDFKHKATKGNNYSYPHPVVPHTLPARILNFVDQFTTPVRPKQIVEHFSGHPRRPVDKNTVYTAMNDLRKARYLKHVVQSDMDGAIHWFIRSTPKSQSHQIKILENIVRRGGQLPPDEVPWKPWDEATSYETLRASTENQKKQQDYAQAATRVAQRAASI